MNEQMLLVRVSSDEGFTAELASVDHILVDQIMRAEAAFGGKLQWARLAGEHFFIGMSDLQRRITVGNLTNHEQFYSPFDAFSGHL